MAIFIAQLLISLDGRNANDAGVPDAEEHEEFNQIFGSADSILFDRENYELLVPAWDVLDLDDPEVSEVEREFAVMFRTKPRLVIAAGLTEVDPLAELVRTDPIPRLTAMKQGDDGRVLVAAGAKLLTTLFAHHLIDEIHVVMRPCLLGGDDSPLNGLLQHTPLALLESRSLASGALVLRYRVLESAETA